MGISDSMEKFLDPESHPEKKKLSWFTWFHHLFEKENHLNHPPSLLHDFGFQPFIFRGSRDMTWPSLRNRLSDWSSIAFGESSKAPKVTNWAHVFCSVWKVCSWKWTGTVHPVFFLMCGFSLILFIHLSPLFSSYICIFTGIQDWKIPKSLSFTFFPLLAGATWRMSSPSFTYPPYFGPAWLT